MTFRTWTVCIFIVFISIPAVSHAFTLSGYRYLPQEAITRVETLNKINNQDLEVEVAFQVHIDDDFSNQNFTWTFSPGEFLHVPPSKDVNIFICEGSTGGTSYDYISVSCNSEADYLIDVEQMEELYIPKTGRKQYDFYNSYDITVKVPENFVRRSFVIKINYTLVNHVFKQGDYYVLWLQFPGFEEKENMRHFVVLPSSKSVPYRFPEDTEFHRTFFRVNEGPEEEATWVFEFKGGKERFVWYFDADELEEKDWNLMLKGVKYGLLGGFLLLIGEIFWSRRERNKSNEALLDELRPRCACGKCGERVKSLGSKYIRGHNLRKQ